LRDAVLLKRDLFGSIERIERVGHCVVRRVAVGSGVPGSRLVARILATHEQTILHRLAGLPGIPRPLGRVGADVFCRTYIDGQPLYESGPLDAAYWQRLIDLVQAIHDAGVAHNDLAKEANILVSDNGIPAIVDFQVALSLGLPRRWLSQKCFAMLCREDIRHVLKHKALHNPELLSQHEAALLGRKSLPVRIWSTTLMRPYQRLICALGWESCRGPEGR
jgi:RIO-like serine/threonine protein kinase